MLNMEERELLRIYSGDRSEVIGKLRRAADHVPDSGIATAMLSAIRELEAMSDADFAALQSV